MVSSKKKVEMRNEKPEIEVKYAEGFRCFQRELAIAAVARRRNNPLHKRRWR